MIPRETPRDRRICRVYEHQVFWLERLAAIVSITRLIVDSPSSMRSKAQNYRYGRSLGTSWLIDGSVGLRRRHEAQIDALAFRIAVAHTMYEVPTNVRAPGNYFGTELRLWNLAPSLSAWCPSFGCRGVLAPVLPVGLGHHA